MSLNLEVVATTSTTASAPSGTGVTRSTTSPSRGAATLTETFGDVGSVALIFALLL